jgi:hypothetical protein
LKTFVPNLIHGVTVLEKLLSTSGIHVGLTGGEASIFEFMDYNAVAP